MKYSVQPTNNNLNHSGLKKKVDFLPARTFKMFYVFKCLFLASPYFLPFCKVPARWRKCWFQPAHTFYQGPWKWDKFRSIFLRFLVNSEGNFLLHPCTDILHGMWHVYIHYSISFVYSLSLCQFLLILHYLIFLFFPVSEVQDKWHSLRTHFVREQKKIRESSSTGASGNQTYKPRMKFSEEMMFIKDFVDIRRTVDSGADDIFDAIIGEDEVCFLWHPSIAVSFYYSSDKYRCSTQAKSEIGKVQKIPRFFKRWLGDLEGNVLWFLFLKVSSDRFLTSMR